MTIAAFWTLLWHRVATGYTALVDFGLIYNFTLSQGPPSTLGVVHNLIVRGLVLFVFCTLLAFIPGDFLYLLWVILRCFGPINRALEKIKNSLPALIQNVSRIFSELQSHGQLLVSINAFLKLCKPFSLCRNPPCSTIVQVNLSAALRYTCWSIPVRRLARP